MPESNKTAGGFPFNIANSTSELSDIRNKWTFDEAHGVWCLEDVLYTHTATTPGFQRLSIYAPAEYMAEGGVLVPEGRHGRFTCANAPVVFENNAAGYLQMPNTWLGGPRDASEKFLDRGMVFVTCGCRGRDSVDADGVLCGKSPWTLVDLKTALRFLRHNAVSLPGDLTHTISVGWSAGGAMSSLLSVTGNNPRYDEYLRANGAFMDESDEVFAAQLYCPIVDLDHADLAYEWQFREDPENESSPAGPHGFMDDFHKALSRKLSDSYVAYFNSLGLSDPETGEPLQFGDDGRSGSAYDYLMGILDDSATDYLQRLRDGRLDEKFTVEQYLSGSYTTEVVALAGPPAAPAGPPAGPAGVSAPMPTLGEMMLQPPVGAEVRKPEMVSCKVPGEDKRSWLSWDGERAHVSNLDDYTLGHRRRMKPCTSFDKLEMDSGENQLFGTAERDYMHFDERIAPAIEALSDEFPEECGEYFEACRSCIGDADQELRKFLLNPLNFIGTDEPADRAQHFRVRVGAMDADTSFIVSMVNAVELANAGFDVDYALVWDQPHSEADYPGELCDWIESICS